MIALGVISAVWLMAKRFDQAKIDSDHASGIALWLVPAGLIGARLYHVATDWQRFQGNWGDALKVWEGGLGILGGLIFGVFAAILYCKHNDLNLRIAMDVVAPALPLAQMIGRWGNYFNQELFGRPTDLPWGLEIDQKNRPANYLAEETFHPTFLYESIWNLLVIFALLKLEKLRKLPSGFLLAAYFTFYSIGRLWVEALRIDEASQLWGLRINIWIFGLVAIMSICVTIKGMRSPRIQTSEEVTVQVSSAEGDQSENPVE